MDFLTRRIKPFLYLGFVYIFLSFILRLIFIFHPITNSSFGVGEFLQMIFLGLIADIPIFIVGSGFLALYFLFISNGKYKNPWGFLILALHLLFLGYIRYVPNNIFKQYGGSVEEIATIFVLIKTICFGLMLISGRKRYVTRNILYLITLFIFTFVIVQNLVSEYFFWNEFGIRYNFIAVDYLIYTNEVIGNIMESYPVVPLFVAIGAVTLLISFWLYAKTRKSLGNLPNFKQKIGLLISYSVLFALSLWAIPHTANIHSENTFTREIQANGIYKFYHAFTHSELDFFQFYPTINQKEAENNFFENFLEQKFIREISPEAEEIRKNVVLISVESLSSEFMEFYGNKEGITPFLDSLSRQSLFFTNFYATGNRTVRGLEALTLCVPPTAGESIVKRKDNKEKFTIGNIFKQKGYSVKYLYGGYSYFDNMEDFFGGNGYDIVDRSHFKPEEISFANIWGVCDEDMAIKAIETMNEQARKGIPFFNHWMSVSNHRPFTYPEGKIDIPSDSKSRAGGVKYTDYALKRFFEMAQKQTWFDDTIFVIVSDHCASSSGKTDLPLERYRIPAMIYAPNFIKPENFTKLTSQIDLMPTLLGLLNFKYTSKFLGQDVFSEQYIPRAFIATYQDLGYLQDDVLTIISPVKKIKQYKLNPQQVDDNVNTLWFEQTPVSEQEINSTYVKKCISAYQTASYLLKEKLLNKLK